MEFRLAASMDLPAIQMTYHKIMEKMAEDQIDIWDELYPNAFFEEDIRQRCLYLLLEQDTVVSAFALPEENAGAEAVCWHMSGEKALYLERFGVHPAYQRQGIGSLMLLKARETAKILGADHLRLFVAEINLPALNLYEKNGFRRAMGIYEEHVDEDFILTEYGYECPL